MCRYLTEQQPPKEVVDFDNPINSSNTFAIEKVARFVSMIPYIEDLRLFQDMPDIYCTSQEFFDLGGGDYEEHAILLANYFSFVDKKQNQQTEIFLVLGAGMPSGHMVYVMRRSINGGGAANKGFELWDPVTA